MDALGDAYEYLIGQFAAGSGKKAGEFYTPQQISDILSTIVTLDSQEPKTGPRQRLESVLDFACGSGSLLLNVRKRMGPCGNGGIGKIYGQEKNITTYNLARMNMLLHGVKDTEFKIFHGDTLANDWDMLRELNPARKPSFDAIVANPPFSYLQRADGHAAEQTAPAQQMAGVCAGAQSRPEHSPGGPAAGHGLEHGVSLAPPLLATAQPVPGQRTARHCRGRRVLFP